jgi:type IV pilus assembly protein PilY1
MYNNTALRVYGGDLLGNLWRFDINDIIPPSGYDAKLLATLKDAGGTAQPITSIPETGTAQNKPVVFVGTGQLLGTPDMTTTGTQSLYAIKDNLTDSGYGNPRSSGSGFVQQTMSVNICSNTNPYCTPGQTIVTVTKHPVDWAANNGWYVDFPVGGERVNTDISLVNGILKVTTNTPQVGACVSAGTSNLYFLDYKTGGYLLEGSEGLALFGHSEDMGSSPKTTCDADGNCSTWRKTDNSEVPAEIEDPPQDVYEIIRRISWRELIIE